MKTEPNKPLYRILSDARRSLAMTQSALAKKVDCKQSAVSMMERGKADALAWSKIEGIAEVLDVSVDAFAPNDEQSNVIGGESHGYCPVFDCPANIPYVVNGKIFALPRKLSIGSEKFCGYCGELLEKACPGCGVKIVEGAACCHECGAAYIATPDSVPQGAEEWTKSHRNILRDIGITDR